MSKPKNLCIRQNEHRSRIAAAMDLNVLDSLNRTIAFAHKKRAERTHRICCDAALPLHFFPVWNLKIFFAGCEIIPIWDVCVCVCVRARNNFACRWRPWTSFFFLALAALPCHFALFHRNASPRHHARRVVRATRRHLLLLFFFIGFCFEWFARTYRALSFHYDDGWWWWW